MNDVQSGFSSYPGGWEASGITRSGAHKFPNPFCDIASEYVPRDIRTVLEMCEYIYLTVGTYRSASRRVVRYFLTEFVLEGESDTEREKYNDFLTKDLKLMTQFAQVGDEYMCFHGDTRVVTRGGIFCIRDLSGKDVEVLSKGGIYRRARFKSFGRQELMEVSFSDGRKVLATPEHQWHVAKSTGGTSIVPTVKLAGRRISRVVAPRPPKNDEYREGVRHGFVFGDGTLYNRTRKTPMTSAMFFGAKDHAVRPYFVGYGNEPVPDLERNATRISGLPGHYKMLPNKDASASYWYGFVCGFMAADGSVDTYGCSVLTQASKTALETIAEQLPRIGMVAGPVREYDVCNTFDRGNGVIEEYRGKSCFVTLLKQFMSVDDLIIDSHKAKFLANKSDSNYGQYIRVESVQPTGIVDDVYCCVEPETHTFVIDNGILTGNCYGNVFISLYFPFDRFLICPECETEFHIKTLKYRFQFRDGSFHGNCPKCKIDVRYKREDRRSPDKSRVKLVRWNPKLMRLRTHLVSREVEYYIELDPLFVKRCRDGIPFFLDDTPWSMIEAMIQNKNNPGNPLYKFKKDAIFHLRETTLSGIPMVGWAIPPVMPNFKLAYYIQILRRYDEAIALDFIVPFRILFPSATAGPQGNDPLQTMNMANFIGHMQNMVEKKRKNITDIQVAPFAVGYEMIGGEAKTLSPKDNIAQAIDELLNAIGFPAELYRGSLSIQAFPVALRLFEKTWGTLVEGYNELGQWVINRISKHFMWGEVKGSLRSVTLADDLERKALALQAAAGMDISKQTAYRPLGIDYTEEQKRVIEEQQMIQKLQQEAMEQTQATQEGGATGGGGAPAPGGDPGATPGDVYEQGKSLAQQLLLNTPDSARRGELIKIKQSNPTLHAIVIEEMNNMRTQMASQGQQMIMQQMKTANARELPSTMKIGMIVADEVLGYSRRDLHKLAMAVKYDRPGAKRAFHFVFTNLRGMI